MEHMPFHADVDVDLWNNECIITWHLILQLLLHLNHFFPTLPPDIGSRRVEIGGGGDGPQIGSPE